MKGGTRKKDNSSTGLLLHDFPIVLLSLSLS
jgi:hypothetical protein